jgi:hypothetical protein
MLAQSGEEFIEDLEATNNTGFWDVAARLAQAGHIVPLASRGLWNCQSDVWNCQETTSLSVTRYFITGGV